MLRISLKNRKNRVTSGRATALLALVCGGMAYGSSAVVSEGAVNAQTSASGFMFENGTEATDLHPGGSREATVTIKNAGAFGQHLKRLTAEVKAVEDSATTEAEAEAGAKCWAGWFEVTEVGGHSGASFGFAETIAGGASVEHSVTVKMREVEKNQNGCLGRKVTLKYTLE